MVFIMLHMVFIVLLYKSYSRQY